MINKNNLIIFKHLLCIALLAIFIVIGTSVNAKSDYKHLPKLDGKLDSEQSNNPNLNPQPTPQENSSNLDKKDNIPKMPDFPVEPEHKISTSTSKPVNKKNFKAATSDVPRLDIINSAVSSTPPSDNLNFTKFFDDVNLLMPDLRDLQNYISKGTTLQLFSAKATTIMFRSKAFLNKYKDNTFSSFESYKLIQNIVTNSVFTKDVWFNTNQIKTNQHGIPDKILQTKFLQISTDIDKLEELIKVHDEMTNE